MKDRLEDFIKEESKKGYIYYKFYENYSSAPSSKPMWGCPTYQFHIYLIRESTDSPNSQTYNTFGESSKKSLIFTSQAPIIEIHTSNSYATIYLGLYTTPLKYNNFSFIETLVKRLLKIYFVNTYAVC